MSTLMIVVLLLCIVVASGITYQKLRHRYVGFGWMLEWQDDRVVIISRLLDSPSGEAGVPIGSVLLEYDGIPLTDEAASEELLSRKVRKGQRSRFKVTLADDTSEEFELIARTVQGPIPVYYPPTKHRRYDRVYSMRRCDRTGQLYESVRMNRAWEALRSGY